MSRHGCQAVVLVMTGGTGRQVGGDGTGLFLDECVECVSGQSFTGGVAFLEGAEHVETSSLGCGTRRRGAQLRHDEAEVGCGMSPQPTADRGPDVRQGHCGLSGLVPFTGPMSPKLGRSRVVPLERIASTTSVVRDA